VRAIAFVVGAASLGAEIAAARLLAPYFGASTIIWANTIATVLVALSIGYAVGGKLADRRVDKPVGIRGDRPEQHHRNGHEHEYRCQGADEPADRQRAKRPHRQPQERVRAERHERQQHGGDEHDPAQTAQVLSAVADTGTVTGRLYAISTAGSLLGTFAAALLLIPLIGTHQTFLVFALALVAAPGAGARRFLLVPIVVGTLFAVPRPAVGAGVAGARVIYSTETQYQYARVLQFSTGERWLQLNEGVAIHSLYRPWSYLTGGYWDDFLVLPLADELGVPKRIAILGDAAGTAARAYGHYFPETRVDGVELDGELTRIGKRYFGLRGPRLHLYTADARPWLAATAAHYDAIFLDAYRQPYIPPGDPRVLRLGPEAPEPRWRGDRQRRSHSWLGLTREGRIGDAARGLPRRHARPGGRDEHAVDCERRAAVGRADPGKRRELTRG
jgi:hypothetical protein